MGADEMIDQDSCGHSYFLDAACIPMRASEMIDHSYAITSPLLPHNFPITSPLLPQCFPLLLSPSQEFPNYSPVSLIPKYFPIACRRGHLKSPLVGLKPLPCLKRLLCCAICRVYFQEPYLHLSLARLRCEVGSNAAPCKNLSSVQLRLSVEAGLFLKLSWCFFEKAFQNHNRTFRRKTSK